MPAPPDADILAEPPGDYGIDASGNLAAAREHER
jgi:hypothetical protein